MILTVVLFHLGQLLEQLRLHFPPDRTVADLKQEILDLRLGVSLDGKTFTFLAKGDAGREPDPRCRRGQGRTLEERCSLASYRLTEADKVYCLVQQPPALVDEASSSPRPAPRANPLLAAQEPRRMRGFDTLIEMGLSREEVGQMREQFYASQTTDRFISPDELLQMEEDWVNREVDPDEARRRQGEGEDEGVTNPFVTGTLIGTDWQLFVGSLCGFLLGILIVPVMFAVPAPLKLKVGYSVGLMGNMLYAVAHIALTN